MEFGNHFTYFINNLGCSVCVVARYGSTARTTAGHDGGWPGRAPVEHAAADPSVSGPIAATDAQPAEYDGWATAVRASATATLLSRGEEGVHVHSVS